MVWVEIHKFFNADAEPDPGSGNLVDPGLGIWDGKVGSGIRDGKVGFGIRDKHPGLATLPTKIVLLLRLYGCGWAFLLLREV
jgi:hypothetical protein